GDRRRTRAGQRRHDEFVRCPAHVDGDDRLRHHQGIPEGRGHGRTVAADRGQIVAARARCRHGSRSLLSTFDSAPRAVAVLVSSYAAGSIPFSYVAARIATGVDLRRPGSGTVSGTGLYEVSGFV